MTDAHDVAATLVSRLGTITAMKLEKLVYYCQAWHLARQGTPLFDEPIEAWAQGPVIRSLYDRHRHLRTIAEWPAGDESRLTPDQQATVDWVIREYGGFSAERLSRMTHSESPWLVARNGLPDSLPSSAPISPGVMASYYSRQRADTETAVSSAVASAGLEGVELDAEWQERLRSVLNGEKDAAALIAEEVSRLAGG